MIPERLSYARAILRDFQDEQNWYSAGIVSELIDIANGVGPKLTALQAHHAKWSQATFGTDQERGPVGPLKHLAKEAQEAADRPRDISEYADCLLLILDATRRAGWTMVDLVDAAECKLIVNRERQWNVPTGKDEPIEHVRRCPHRTPELGTIHADGGHPEHVPAPAA